MVSFGILCFPDVQQLDLTAPYEIFASAKDANVSLVWKNLEPLRSATGLWLKPDITFADAPAFDVLCIPGGKGVNALLRDVETLDFIRKQASDARFITSVCTGSLLLGAAGLLAGKHATTHWNAHDFLARFGAIPTHGRIVRDGALITAGGVTSGLDFGLELIAELLGREEAEAIQLALEYAPEPPFNSGTPEEASEATLAMVRKKLEKSRQEREKILSAPR